ncbi:nicotinate-nucleotide--dimethylbenzimidazole phosphoribosyltransferase [Streptomyces sp. NPDC052682]|uniref:nicotinate-nucleotide--dimethylbenzimidazole phosphoribosyltransferase n=1 Tax=Streptomyces sp. NPDC052682 TaxID=3154954 RepID=UPI00341627CE
MTDTGQVPGEGLPESAGTVEQPGVPAHGSYAYVSETTAEDEDLLLPGAQGAWGNEVPPPAPEPVVEAVHQPEAHELSGRDSGSVDLGGVRLPDPPPIPPITPRRPLHLGPPLPDTSASPVRSLADRGPAGAPVRQPAAPATGPEYLDAPRAQQAPAQAAPQPAAPWGAQPVAQAPVSAGAAPAETVVPAAGPVGAAQAVVARVATEAGAQVQDGGAQVPQGTQAPGGEPVAEAPATEGAAAGTAPEAGQGLADGSAGDGGPDVAPASDASDAQHPGAAGETVQAPEAAEAPESAAPEHAQASEAPGGGEPEVVEPVEPAAQVAGTASVEPAAQVTGAEDVAQGQETAGPEAATPAQDSPEPTGGEAGVPAPEASGPAPVAAPASEGGTPETAAQTPQAAGPEGAQAPEAAAAPAPAEEAEPVASAPVTEPAAPAEAVSPPPGEAAPAPAPEATPVPPAADAAQSPQPADGSPAPGQEVATVSPEQVQPQPGTEQVAQHPQPDTEQVAQPSHPDPDPAGHTPQTAPVSAAQQQQDQDGQPVAEAQQPLPEAQQLQHVQGPQQTQASQAFPPAPEGQAAEGQAVIPAQPGPVDPVPPGVEAGGATPDASARSADVPAPQQPAAGPAPAPAPAPAPEAPAEAGPGDATPQPGGLPQQPQPHPDQPVGESVPVESPVPNAPAPSPAVTAQQQAPEPAAAVPAPRAEEDADAAAGTGPELLQNADDLDTRAADQEDPHDQQVEQAPQVPEEESTAAVAEERQSTGPAAPPYADAEREAVLKVMRERRDIRNGFRSDPIPHEVLLRVLEAAHTAPSVGHSQPWDFVVIRSAETRRTMHELAMRQREAYAKSLPKGRAKQFKELKIEAILDTPVNIVVTADPTRGGRHTLGRHTQPQMAPYSAALAVENLWLAARAEGLGVGWVSFFDEREMVRALGLPEHLEVIAYLCVGYVDEFPDEPELMQAGWSKRRPLSWVVHEETYGRRALPGEEPHDLLAETVAQIRPLDAKALGEAWERQKRMTKPAGALGMLEIISAQLSGLSRQCPPPIPEPAAVAIFAGDHGVHAQGVTPWPQEVTAQMVANFLGGGAVCNAFATQVGAEVCVVDVGVAADLPATPGLLPRKVRAGTSDMTTGPAMTREEAKKAIEVGIETARDLVAAGNKALLTGEMGIANTTASAALIAVFTGADPAEVTGRGTGINDETLARKTDVVRRALELHQPDPADPIGVLAAVGGFEHAALVGLLLGGASLRTPVILDGVSAGAAALVARAIAPEVLAACIAGHRSAEPGHVAALNKLGLRPLVDLDLRLGEGTGALLALPLVQSTARAMHEVATFDSAGVTEK